MKALIRNLFFLSPEQEHNVFDLNIPITDAAK